MLSVTTYVVKLFSCNLDVSMTLEKQVVAWTLITNLHYTYGDTDVIKLLNNKLNLLCVT